MQGRAELRGWSSEPGQGRAELRWWSSEPGQGRAGQSRAEVVEQ